MPHDALSLPAELVDRLFPFHILLSSEGNRILAVGEGLKPILMNDFTGVAFDRKFEIERPEIDELTPEFLNNNTRAAFVLAVKNTEVVLRGQFLVPSERQLLFVGSILVKSSNSLEKLSVNLSVFPPVDLTPDIVILHKFRELENRDQKQRAQHLSELAKSRDEMSTHANTDELTEVANRRGFWAKGEQILTEYGKDSASRIMLALLDLDGFKTINDQYGHEAGDAILRETAERISAVIGLKGLVGRLGGDEFVFLLILDEFESAQTRLREVVTALNLPFDRRHQRLPIRGSIGVTQIQLGETLEQAIHHADLAMYDGRLTSRGKISWYTDDMQRRIDEKDIILKSLRKAIDEEKIEPHFQPIIQLSSSKLVSFEALARWNDSKLGNIRPDIFIALAEECGMLAKLDSQVLEKSLDQLLKWRGDGKDYSIHVNLSAPSLKYELVDQVIAALASRNLEPGCLTLELTETTLLDNTVLAREILGRLTDHGVKLQLDDFGTGFSSLSHIRDFPVNGIKIDKSFVEDAHTSDKSRVLLGSVVALAQNLNLDIVAEGIETQEQMEFLKNLECQYGQGFYIGRPGQSHCCEDLFPQLKHKAA